MKAIVGLILALTSLVQSSPAEAQSSSYSSCYAYTQCYARDNFGNLYKNGVISCKVYGSSYAFGTSQSACTWSVRPYQSVECKGYVQSTDWNGNTVWGWQSYYYTCP